MKVDTRFTGTLILIGVALILIGETLHSPSTHEISDITTEHIGQHVTVSGTVQQIDTHGEVTFMNLRENKALDIVSFTPVHDIHEEDNVQITGTVTLYEGQLEILIDRIEVT